MMCDHLKKIWTASLGVFLALLMFGLNVSHGIDLHLDIAHQHQHCDDSSNAAASSDSPDTNQQSGHQSHAAIHHCHGASCYFLTNAPIPDVLAPTASEFILSSTALLRLSYGIDGEEIDPPKV